MQRWIGRTRSRGSEHILSQPSGLGPPRCEQTHGSLVGNFRAVADGEELLHNELSAQLPAAKRPATQDPQDLARAAPRAEVSRPGFMERILGQRGSGQSGAGRKSMGSMAAGAAGGLGIGLLGGVAGAFIGTAIAGPLLDGFAGLGEEFGSMAEGPGRERGGSRRAILGRRRRIR